MAKLRQSATAKQDAGRSQIDSNGFIGENHAEMFEKITTLREKDEAIKSDDVFKRQMPFTPAFTNRWELIHDTPTNCLENVYAWDFEAILLFEMIYSSMLGGNFENPICISVRFRRIRKLDEGLGKGTILTRVDYLLQQSSIALGIITKPHRFGAPSMYCYDENGIVHLTWELDGAELSTGSFWHIMAETWGDVLYRCTWKRIGSKYKGYKRCRIFFNPSTDYDFIPSPRYVTVTKKKKKTYYETVWYWQGKRVGMKKYWYEVERFFDFVRLGKERMVIAL